MDSNTKSFLIGLTSSIAAGFIVYLFLKDKGDGATAQTSSNVKADRYNLINTPISSATSKPLFSFTKFIDKSLSGNPDVKQL